MTAELMVVKLVDAHKLQKFLLNVSSEIRNEINSAQKLFHLTSIDSGIKDHVEASVGMANFAFVNKLVSVLLTWKNLSDACFLEENKQVNVNVSKPMKYALVPTG